MRPITTHAINPCNRALLLKALPGESAGASVAYAIHLEQQEVPGADHMRQHPLLPVVLAFHRGPVGPDGNGLNGLTHEALLAILIDRLQGFQTGPYACPENAAVLGHLQAAVAILAARTKRRDSQGIEGTLVLDPPVLEPLETLELRSGGQIAYEAYAGSTGWKSAISGAPLPVWADQAIVVRVAWERAAEAVARQVTAAVLAPATPGTVECDVDDAMRTIRPHHGRPPLTEGDLNAG